MYEKKNKVIIIGGEHYNALGVIRSLGESGVNPYLILISNAKISPCSSSKYVKKVFKIESCKEEDILKCLQENFNNETEKPILIPTGDPIEKLLDSNYDMLSKKYILPNIDNTQGLILKHMDKAFQHNLCKKYGINVAKSWLIDLNNMNEYIDIMPIKVIAKPNVSAEGQKSDIMILEGKENIKNGFIEFKNKGYKEIIVQEFIDYDMEYAMMGIACNQKVIIPGINSNDFIYPNKKGNTSYAKMFPLDDFDMDVSNIINMIKDMKYTGLFEVEMFKKGNVIYFNEMNFRNSANLYGYAGGNVEYIYLYLNLILGNNIDKLNTKVDKHYSFCVEPSHLKNVKEGLLTYSECFKNIKNSTKLIYNKNDKKPFFKKIENAIYSRIIYK